jgi:glycosyltransferase involved in cell wall biosynthesis
MKNKNLKTLFLDQGETLGGAERFLIDFLKSLNLVEQRTIRPVILGAKIPEYRQMIGDSAKILDFDYPQVRGGVFKKLLASGRLLQAAKKLKEIIEHENIGQVFANTPRTIFILWIAKFFFHLKARAIIMIHDFTIPQFLLRKISAKTDIIIVNSVPTRTIVRQIIPAEYYGKMRIVENGIDLNPLAPLSGGKVQKIEKVLIIGRLDPKKGQMYLLQAAKLLQDENSDLKFFIVGSSFPQDPRTVEYEKELRKFAEIHDLKNVFFLPEVENPFEAIMGADMVLALSTEPETFGRIVTEGLAMGKLVLSFDQMGPRDILKNFARFCNLSVQPLLVQKNSAKDLAKKIQFFAENPDVLEEFVKNSRDFVEKNYPLRETKKRFMNILVGV